MKEEMEKEERKFEANVTGFALSVVTPEIEVKNNVAGLVSFISERMKDYSPDKYMGDADMARKDRAELNKGAEQVKTVRQSIQELNPYGDVLDQLINAEKLIKSGSDALGLIVKAKENEEKKAKKQVVQSEWDRRGFDLFPLDKVFNPKWLNKTYKLDDIAAEMTAIIERCHRDLKAIENYSDDAETLKAHYLMCLDIGETMDYGEELKKKRELAAKEAAAREGREHEEKIAAQGKQVRKDFVRQARSERVAEIVAEATGGEPAAGVSEYTITVRVTDWQLLKIKEFINSIGVEFECNKLEF